MNIDKIFHERNFMKETENYASLSVQKLIELAQERGIKGVRGKKKDSLVEIHKKYDDAVAAGESDPAGVANPAKRRGRPPKNANAKAKEEEPEKKQSSEGKPVKTAAPKTEEAARPEEKKEGTENHNNTGDNQKQKRPYHKRDQNGRNFQYSGQGSQQHGRGQKPQRGKNAGGEHRTYNQHRPHQQNNNQNTPEENKEVQKPQEAAAATNARSEQTVEIPHYDDAKPCSGMLEIMSEGYGFLRSGGYLQGDNDVYVSQSQIRRFRLRTGDVITGQTRRNNPNDKYGALLFIESVNGINPEACTRRTPFEKLTPVFPNERIRLERPGGSIAVRIMDIISPIGKGQRGMIVSPPKAGKTTLLKQVAMSVMRNNPEIHLIILLIDERPEEVTDMRETVENFGGHCEVLASTFDEMPENHKRLSEMVIEHAKRRVELGQDVMILLDSITRLARAYNLTVPPSGRTLSGGLDPAALHMPKSFFGAARNMKEGGSLTILATALIDTGSRMDDVVYEEFKGTGNMELVLDRSLSEKRVFPAIDLAKSSTRRDDLLYTQDERLVVEKLRRDLSGLRSEESAETIIATISGTSTNGEFISKMMSSM
jgi:transcription termination factor Rho